jgi:hypothetical protein
VSSEVEEKEEKDGEDGERRRSRREPLVLAQLFECGGPCLLFCLQRQENQAFPPAFPPSAHHRSSLDSSSEIRSDHKVSLRKILFGKARTSISVDRDDSIRRGVP